MQTQSASDYDAESDAASTIVGLMHRAERGINDNAVIASARQHISEDYLTHLAVGSDELDCEIGLTPTSRLLPVLEKLELSFRPAGPGAPKLRHGLGYSNALFMSAELLLLDNATLAPLLLIEEPEAHLHPQLQSRVIDLLLSRADGNRLSSSVSAEAAEATDATAESDAGVVPLLETKPVQIIVTTHSPNMASALPVEALAIVSENAVYSLAQNQTRLLSGDYRFLRRFLDVTKSNLFFARGVVVVEGDAETILLPALAAKVGNSFSKLGVSVVNVGHVGLFRYSRIFQRTDGKAMPVRVACVRDMDVPPAGTPQELKGKLKAANEFSAEDLAARRAKLSSEDEGAVKTFVSDSWTLEYDFAAASWAAATIAHQAASLAAKADSSGAIDDVQRKEVIAQAHAAIDAAKFAGQPLETVALKIFAPLRNKSISKVVTAQFLAELLDDSHLASTDLPKYLQETFEYLSVL
ncbi:hypothetical protein GCM10022197_26270 [Microlunatus spumicola]|uniref:ATP-dependent endonuclease n=2 Tax=Microlunatus spumicola TaxID=81499 RepID=A0ABP6XR30_9ACTN